MGDLLPLFRAGRQAVKFRVLLYFSFLCFLASLAGAYAIAFGVEDEATSTEEKWILAAVVLLCGVGFFAGMMLYATRYVLALWSDAHPRVVAIETMRFHGSVRREHRVSDLGGVEYRAGKLRTHHHRIETPYLKVRVRGQRLPYIVDLQGSIVDRTRFERLMRGLGGRS